MINYIIQGIKIVGYSVDLLPNNTKMFYATFSEMDTISINEKFTEIKFYSPIEQNTYSFNICPRLAKHLIKELEQNAGL